MRRIKKQIKTLIKEIDGIDRQIKGLNSDIVILDDPMTKQLNSWLIANFDCHHRAWIMHRSTLMKRRAKQKNLWPIGCFCPKCQAGRS